MEKKHESLITKAIIASILGGLTLTILVLWGVGVDNIITQFLNAKWYLILGYIIVSIAIALGVTYKWMIVLDAYGVKLPFYTLFIYRLIGFAVGYVTPMSHVGGEPVRALLVGKQGIPYKVSFSAVLVDKLLEMFFNVGIFFLGALLIVNSSSFPLVARGTIFFISLLLIVGATLFSYNILKKKKVFVPLLKLLRFNKRKNWKRLKKSANEFELLIEHFYANRKRHFQRSMLMNAILWALMFIEYKLALLILGHNANVFGIFLFLTGVGIAYSIPIPAALGVLELGQISAGALLGIQASIGVALAFLIRMRDIVWTILGLILLGAFHFNIFKLYEKSSAAAKKYNLEKLHLEMRSLYEDISEELR
jgi:uncharacterized protein (TIRG00374 family)